MSSIRPIPFRPLSCRPSIRCPWFATAFVVVSAAACTVTEAERRTLAVTVPVAGCAAAGNVHNTVEAPQRDAEAPPALAEWEAAMVDYGRRRGDDLLAAEGYTERLNLTYYDAQRVFLQISAYTGEDEPWQDYADVAEAAYKTYLERNDFGVAGWMRFPHGLFMDWEKTGDEQSRDYLFRLRDHGAFSNPEQPPFSKQWRDSRYSREIAYALETQVLAERAGAPPQRTRVNLYVDMALDHVDAWVTGDFGHDDPERRFCQAFMTGLTASALIAYDDHLVRTGGERDPRVLTQIERLADWLWQTMWIAGVGGGRGDWYPHDGSAYGAFEYVQPTVKGVGSETPSPDLNMLIVPMYGWLYERTGASRFRDRGDAIFAGGVKLGTLDANKQFNQSYRSSFDYVESRRAASVTASN